ncbi:flavin-containing monooxygenase 5-like [Xyrichtys novacula]|uniref:Flavin-containing monooxygenase n=1 Tax=Xyrichtys novacula TaxID=13765 RepID=A0AAV1FFB7_XYRNO|nr:flavin-containing monooxygenase 5-like [Xyrichtys novacula]
MVRKVLVIGAGISGLTSIKACLDEGLEPTCFESGHDMEEPEPGRANIYFSVILNSSKERMAYSDFPPPAELPNNMHHSEVLLYLRLYAQNFNLLQHIHFKVLRALRASTTTAGITAVPKVCMEREWWWWGSGALEVILPWTSAELLKSRSGAWVVSRVGEGGLPVDMLGVSRLDMMLQRLFPSWSARVLENKVNKVFDHRLYGLKPKHGIFAQNAVVSDDLPARIISGRVQVKPNVKEFRGSRVVFEDGSSLDKVDLVVFATGYNYGFPFLPPELQTKCGYRLRLYKHVFPPSLTPPTLAVVGFVHGLGALTPMAEMQARWATRVFKGLIHLPSEETMLQDIERDMATMHQKYACSEHTPIQVDYIPYLDSLADLVGVRPNIPRLFLKDPRLAMEILLGPCTSYQYRLSGPGQWAGARQAILTQWERVLQPFRSRVLPEPEHKPSSGLSIMMVFSGEALLCCFFINKQTLSSFFPLKLSH